MLNNKTVKFDDLPLWVQNNIKHQQGPYIDYFEAKWIEEVDLKKLSVTLADQVNNKDQLQAHHPEDCMLNPDQSLPKYVFELLDNVPENYYVRVTLLDGTRVLGLNTVIGPVALYEIHSATEVPIDEKGTKASVILPNYKLYAPPIFWKAHLLELDEKGGVNLITFLYLFGLSDPKVPKEKRNLSNIAVRLNLVAAELGRRMHERNGDADGTSVDN